MLKKTTETTLLQYLLEFAEQVKKDGESLLFPHGLTSQQWLLLLHLANDPNLPFFDGRPEKSPVLASELAEFFKVSRANITNLLNTLSNKELILQQTDHSDRRRKTLHLTESGKQLVYSIDTLRHEANARLLSTFSEEEKQLFHEFVKQCLTSLDH